MGSREGDSAIEVSSGEEAQQAADFDSATDTQPDSAYEGNTAQRPPPHIPPDIPEHPVNDQINDEGIGNIDNDGSHQDEVNIRDEGDIRDGDIRDGENHLNEENRHDDEDVSGDGDRDASVINDDRSSNNPQGERNRVTGVNNPEGGRHEDGNVENNCLEDGFEAICQGVANLPNNEKALRFLRTRYKKLAQSVSSGYPRTNLSSDSERKSFISDVGSEDSNAADSEGEDPVSLDEVDSHGNTRLHKRVIQHQYKKVLSIMQDLTTVEKHTMIGIRNEIGETPLDVMQTRRMAFLLVSGVDDVDLSTKLVQERKLFGSHEIDYELWKDAEDNTIMHLAAAIGHERMIKDALINGYPLEFLRKTNKDGHVPYDLKKNHATGNLLAWAETLGPKSYPLIVPPSFIVIVCDMDMPGLEQDISSLTAVAKVFGTEAVFIEKPTRKEIQGLLQGERSRDLSAVIVVLICHSISGGSILVQNQPVAIQNLLHHLNPKKKKGIPKILIIQRCENPTCSAGAAYNGHPDDDDTEQAKGYDTHAPDTAILDIRIHGDKSWSTSGLTKYLIESDSGDSLYHIYKEIVRSIAKANAKRSGLPPSIPPSIKTSFRAYLRLKKVYKEEFDYEKERAAKTSNSCPIEDEHQGSC